MERVGYIQINYGDYEFTLNHMSGTMCIAIGSEEALDSIIEQCRDIKLKLMEAANEKQ